MWSRSGQPEYRWKRIATLGGRDSQRPGGVGAAVGTAPGFPPPAKIVTEGVKGRR
ncbi:MAG: hypothetical protein CHACPFDD_02153 [Phycisphaerae bacterium]|nr:hypothetical protein [Phycisphaerae bacterium]